MDDHSHDHEHGHSHDHGHTHDHDGGPSAEAPIADVGISVMLDIGDDVGALVVYLDPQPAGTEIEICPVGDVAAKFHTGVHQRPVGHTMVDTAVYPSVPAGRYELLDADLHPCATVDVAGGVVAELDLRVAARTLEATAH